MLEAIEALVGHANQLVGLFTVLRERGYAVVHVDTDAELQRLQRFGENGFDAAAERQGLVRIGLRQ